MVWIRTRRSEDQRWAIRKDKEVKSNSKEGLITCYLSSEHLKNDPRNHAIPVLDVLRDVVRPDSVLLVLPLLRHTTYPSISSVSEALDLVGQTLEGLVFLHEHEIAHRNCAFETIMMDGRALFPTQWHPQSPNYDLQIQFYKHIKSRTDVGGVRYYFTNFDLSTKGKVRVTGVAGFEDSPELSHRVPYNPYKLDVYILGKMYQRILLGQFINLTLLEPLVKLMTSEKPKDRLTAAGAYAMFQEFQSKLNVSLFSQRLLTKEESKVIRLIKGSRYWLHEQWVRRRPKPRLPPFH
ncbi:hypothetical protein FRC01_000952 [Tulasnella sp. 417]|nr:hypothetical protein FRC01_000952 [Tulasnella sp. 417]